MGEFADYLKTWNWELGFRYSRNEGQDLSIGEVSQPGLREALLDTDPASAFDPFLNFNAHNTRAARARVYVSLHETGEFEFPLGYATINGAKALRLDNKTGSLTPGKEADIIILDATALNVAPLNQVPGAVVSLMDRTNVETVIVAGKIRKWKGKLLGLDLPALRNRLEASRDYVFAAANIPQNPFGPQ